jgi:hypothetical protein
LDENDDSNFKIERRFYKVINPNSLDEDGKKKFSFLLDSSRRRQRQIVISPFISVHNTMPLQMGVQFREQKIAVSSQSSRVFIYYSFQIIY